MHQIEKDMLKKLFTNNKKYQNYNNLDFKNKNEDVKKFMEEDIVKQILYIGEIIDEQSDSSFQNAILVMNQHDIKFFNILTLGISYGNFRMLEKAQQQMQELPKITLIQLGFNEQEMNKKYLFFNASSNKEDSVMKNIQFINIFHAPSGEMKKYLQKGGYKKIDHEQDKDYGNQEFNYTQNCIEIEINNFLNKQKSNDSKNTQDIFFLGREKCPKIIGSKEFLYLFEQVIKIVKNQKSNIIIFSYDFSFTKAHNHFYDLNVDVLGYFCQMLSLVSNHHLIFALNTNHENHFFQQPNKSVEQIYGLDGDKSLRNYMSIHQIQTIFDEYRNPNLTELFKYIIEAPSTYRDDESGDENEATTTLEYEICTKEGVWINKKDDNNNDKLQIQKIVNELLICSQHSFYQNYLKNELNISKQFKKEISKDDTCGQKNFKQEKSEEDTTNENQTSKQKNKIQLALDSILLTSNFYQFIQDQLYAVCFSLLQTINYLNNISSKKSYGQPEFLFMKDINDQIRSSILPSKKSINTNLLPHKQDKVNWNSTQVKVFEYSTKIKSIEHIRKFVKTANEQKFNLFKLKQISNEGLSKQLDKEKNINENKKQVLDKETENKEIEYFKSEELKTRMNLKRYTSVLFNNYIYDLRRKRNIYLNIKDSKLKFYYQERSQYIIDYEQNDQKIIIYFFNVQRANLFKNFILTEVDKDMFIQKEIKLEEPKLLEYMWKIFMNNNNLKNFQNDFFPKQTRNEQQNPKDINYATYYIHDENFEDLELFNSTLCLSENYIIRMFGEIINPHNWKQKEYQLLIFTIPRMKGFSKSEQKNTIMKLVNLDFYNQHLIFNTIPRSGCTAIILKDDDGKDNIFVFGGTSQNGFIYNAVEQYQILPDGLLQQISIKNKQAYQQKTFRPLFCPFTFVYNQEIYFFGGEYGKKFFSKALDQVYFQKYNIKEGQFQIVHSLNQKDIIPNLKIADREIQKYQKFFSSMNKKISYSSTNINHYQKQKKFKFAFTININSNTLQILQKTVIVKLNLDKQLIQQVNTQQPINQQKSKGLNQIPEIKSKIIISSEFKENIVIQEHKRNLEFFYPLRADNHISQLFDVDSTDFINYKRLIMPDMIEEINKQSQYAFSEKTKILNQKEEENYIKYINKNIHESSDQKIFFPKYILLNNHKLIQQNKIFPQYLMSIITKSKNEQILQPQFRVVICLADEDYKDYCLSNNLLFITFNVNFKMEINNFFKTISIFEAQEFQKNFKDIGILKNQLFYSKVRFNQNKLTRLQFEIFDEELNMINPDFINRYVICDENYVYLLNGVNLEVLENYEPYKSNKMNYYQLSPCERINIKDKVAEKIDDCIFLEQCKIIQNEEYIFYIGLYETNSCLQQNEPQYDLSDNTSTVQPSDDTTGSHPYYKPDKENTSDLPDKICIAQIFSKQKSKWRICQIQIEQIVRNFEYFEFILGNQPNKIFAIRQKYTYPENFIYQAEIIFDLNRTVSMFRDDELYFDLKNQNYIQVIPSAYYSGTIYIAQEFNKQYPEFSALSVISTHKREVLF